MQFSLGKQFSKQQMPTQNWTTKKVKCQWGNNLSRDKEEEKKKEKKKEEITALLNFLRVLITYCFVWFVDFSLGPATLVSWS